MSKSVVISGASRGIGLALVEHFLKQQFTVYGIVRQINEPLKQLKITYSNQLTICEVDLADSKMVEDRILEFEKLINLNSEIILINNAGISAGGPFEILSYQHWVELYQVNLLAIVQLTKIFLPKIRKTKGRIINIGSVSGRIASPYLTSYASSKFALRGLTDGLRRELRRFAIRVILIEPGPVDTGIWETSQKRSHNMLNLADKNLSDIYSTQIKKLNDEINNIHKSTVDVSHVVNAVQVSVVSQKPKIYYMVGKNKFLIKLVSLMPGWIVDILLS